MWFIRGITETQRNVVINMLAELKRRNVIKVAGLYAVIALLIMQVAVVFEDTMNLPAWFDSTVTAALILCLPIVLLARAFEMSPEGIKRTEGVDGELAQSERKTDLAIEPEVQTNSASIAVLTLSDLSPSGDQEYFSDGIAEELLNVLAKVDGLKVASRKSAFAFIGQDTLGISCQALPNDDFICR
jgi:hypothetical protein